MIENQNETNNAERIITRIEFTLKKSPTQEFLDLLDELYWKEKIYECEHRFNPLEDKWRYALSIMLPYHFARAVWHKINALILKHQLN